MKAFTIALFALIAVASVSAQDASPYAVQLDTTAYDAAVVRIDENIKFLQGVCSNVQTTISSTVSGAVNQVNGAQNAVSSAIETAGSGIAKTIGGLVTRLLTTILNLVASIQSQLGSTQSQLGISQSKIDGCLNVINHLKAAAANAASQEELDSITASLNSISDNIEETKNDLGVAVTKLVTTVTNAVAGVVKLLEDALAAIVGRKFADLGNLILNALGDLIKDVMVIPAQIRTAVQEALKVVGDLLHGLFMKVQNIAPVQISVNV